MPTRGGLVRSHTGRRSRVGVVGVSAATGQRRPASASSAAAQAARARMTKASGGASLGMSYLRARASRSKVGTVVVVARSMVVKRPPNAEAQAVVL